MKSTVDKNQCQGHGMCWMVAGEFFVSDDDGYSEAVSEDVPTDQESNVRDAAKMCPESAISVTD